MTISNLTRKDPGPRESSEVPGQVRRRVTLEGAEDIEEGLAKIKKRIGEVRGENVTCHVTLSTERDE